jgi:hypothetical protein
MSLRGKGRSKLLIVGVGVVVVVVVTGEEVMGGGVVDVGWSVNVVVAGVEVVGSVEDSGGVERVISLAHPDRSETHRITISTTLESVL